MEWSFTRLLPSLMFFCFCIKVNCFHPKILDFNPLSTPPGNMLGSKDLDSDEMATILKEELQLMRKDLTAMFVGELSRKKRETESYEYEVVVEPLETRYGPGVNSSFRSDKVAPEAAIFNDRIVIFRRDAIYNLQERDLSNASSYSNGTHVIEEVLLALWGLHDPGDDYRVTASIERNNILFILVTAKKAGFSYLFTYSPLRSKITLRQRIRNHGVVTAAKFFIYHDTLYLVITHDNEVHSITLCPIFKWMGTHLDEIHSIQTRGASSVAVCEISGYLYMAFAQSVDASGNKEIGTQIVRMDRASDVEKVQLLYSDSPQSLFFTKFLHEHILIIVQEKMPAIVYFFGGYDFIYLQHLKTLKGTGVKLVSVIAPDGETFILASNGSHITTYSRSAEISRLTALMFVPYPTTTYTAPRNTRITGMTVKPPKFADDGTQEDKLIFAINLAPVGDSTEGYSVELLILHFEQVLKASSSYQQPEDKLSKCLLDLQASLAKSEPYIGRLQQSNSVILRKSANMVYQGTLSSQTSVLVDSDTTKTESISIKPNVNADDKSQHSPSIILKKIESGAGYLNGAMKERLNQVFLRGQTNTVTGSLNFINGVTVDELTANKARAENLNGISWRQLRTNVLRLDRGKPQIVYGNWTVDEIQSDEIRTTETIGGVNISDILLTRTRYGEPQTVRGPVEFAKSVKINDLRVPPSKHINDIRIRDIINTTAGRPTVVDRNIGVGHVNVKSGATVGLINEVNLADWYDSVLKTAGPDQIASGSHFLHSEFHAENVTVDRINGKNWEEFLESVLLDGRDEVITGEPRIDNLHVLHLDAVSINGISIEGLLKKYTNQTISTPVHLKELHVKGNITASRVNGVDLTDNFLVYNEDASIFGPLTIQNVTVKNLEFEDGVRLSSIDIAKAERARKTIVYRIKGDPNVPIALHGIYAQDVDTAGVNNFHIGNFRQKYWTGSGPNDVPVHFDLSDTRVIVTRGFKSEKINGVPVKDYVKIRDVSPSAPAERINTTITFTTATVIHGDANLAPGVRINNMDISEIAPHLVHYNDSGMVYGTKTLTQPIVASHGISVGSINGDEVEKDFVRLKNGRTLYTLHDLTFRQLNAESIDVEEPIIIGGTLNGLQISEIKEKAVYTDNAISIDSDVEFLGQVEADDLFVAGEMNGLVVPDVLERLIHLNNGNVTQYIYKNIIVEEDIEFHAPVEMKHFNGINPESYFSSLVNRSGDQHFQGAKKFKGEVIVEGDLICEHGRINDIFLGELESEAVSKTKDQTIHGKIHFQELYAPNINAPALCGIPVSDFVRIDDPHVIEINSPLAFTKAVEVLHDVNLHGTFNGVDIHEAKKNLTHSHGSRFFENVTCHGDLTWMEDQPHLHSFSNLFENAVQYESNHPRTVNGKVKFLHGFRAKAIVTEEWFNGVDLEDIKSDGVHPNQDVNFTGYNHIPSMRISRAGSLDVLDTLDTDHVNGVNLKELIRDVVRRDQSEVVTGKKTFENDVQAESIYTENINGCKVSDMAVNNDNRTIASITLESVDGIRDLNFKHLNIFNWDEFLRNRVTRNSDQNIIGNWVINGDVTVNGVHVGVVNGLRIAHAVRTNSPEAQHIHGTKVLGGLEILSDFHADAINERNIDNFCSVMVHKDRPEEFDQTVYMQAPVEFYKNIGVDGDFMGYDIKKLNESFEEKLHHFKLRSVPSNATKTETQKLLGILEEQVQDGAVWLDYLTLALSPHLESLNPDRVEVAVVDEVARIAFSKLTPVTNNECGLLNGCLKNSVEMVEFRKDGSRQFPPLECANIFELSSSFTAEPYAVVSRVVSYNKTCVSSTPEEPTKIYAMTKSSNWSASHNEALLAEIATGYITDVKTFHNGGVDYLVISQFSSSQVAEIAVYAIQDRTVRKVQSIPTKGTIRIAMDHIHGNCFLGVANTFSTVPSPHIHEEYDDEEDFDIVSTAYSELYIWSGPSSPPGNEHFILLREIGTENVVDLQFVEVYPNDHGFDRESFIAFVHSSNVVEIFKYHTDTSNFYLFQTLAFDDEYRLSSLSSFSLKGSTYLTISSLPQGLLIYQYRGIEGFKLYLEVPLAAVHDAKNFVLEGQLFFPVASETPIIAEGRIQGPAFQY